MVIALESAEMAKCDSETIPLVPFHWTVSPSSASVAEVSDKNAPFVVDLIDSNSAFKDAIAARDSKS